MIKVTLGYNLGDIVMIMIIFCMIIFGMLLFVPKINNTLCNGLWATKINLTERS